MKMRVFITCSVLMFIFMSIISADTYLEEKKTRDINIVYDDSISMIRRWKDDAKTEREYHEAWGQAKYATEVFAAMLDELDVMKVFAMSDFIGQTGSPPRLVIKGADSDQSRVDQVHDMLTKADGTPFAAVEAAARDLQDSGADERWLVVLTDGAFDEGVDFENRIKQYSNEGIQVIFLAMGKDAARITNNPAAGIYFEQAQTSEQILAKIIAISNRIFSRNTLRNYSESAKTCEFDVPLKQMIVFAQGDRPVVHGLISDQQKLEPTSDVNVKYSKKAASNFVDDYQVVVSDELNGVVVYFEDIPSGSYKLDVSGASDVELYYKPDVKLGFMLMKDGQVINPDGEIFTGEYTVEYGILNEDGEIFESELLGDLTTQCVVNNNGNEVILNNGDTIDLIRGDADIFIEARYLEYNTISRNIDFRVYEEPIPLDMKLTYPEGVFGVNTLGKDNKNITLTIYQDGMKLGREQWQSMEMPIVSTGSNIILDVERGISAGEFIIKPSLQDDDRFAADKGEILFDVKAEVIYDEQLSRGSTEGMFLIEDDIPFWDKLKDFWNRYKKIIIISLLILLLILGYIPPFKRYFNKRIRRAPMISESENNSYGEADEFYGSFKKNFLATILPYVDQRAKFRYATGPMGAPVIKAKASKKKKITVQNYQAFAGIENIKFNDDPKPLTTKKPFDITVGTSITVERDNRTSECSLNK